jgi:hypothetical protein
MSDKKNQAQLPLFTVIFEDGSHFIGGNSYFKTKWLEIPLKKIKRIFYKLPSNDYICLAGYEKYYHMVEATKDLMGKEKGIIKLPYVYIMGEKGNKVRSYRITLLPKDNNRYKMGDVTSRIFDINDKFIQGLNPDNWR